MAAMVFGVIALIWPDVTVGALVIVFGIFAISDGVVEIAGAFMGGIANDSRLMRIVRGVVSIIAGVVAFVWPGITALTLLYIVAIWALIIGVAEILAAVRLRREIEGEWLLGIGGLMSIAFGVFAIIFPGAGILSLTWLVGIYAILFGITLIALGIEVRRLARDRGPRVMM
jgi:uncharacterized membrane protein HdeD (DUF308 family)